jgi:SAM-dependent methyltransferase
VSAPSAFRCRGCGGNAARTVLDFGAMPLANRLLDSLDEAAAERLYPLKFVFCTNCALAQIVETVPPADLFLDYPYFSSYSDTMVEHARVLVERLVDREKLGPDSLVIELASNDGYLLKHYQARGVPVLGVDPAANVAAVAEARGIPTRCVFFNAEVARAMVAEGLRADVMHAHNVLAHVPDLHGFIEGIGLLLAPDGIAVIEVPYLRDMIDGCEFDTVYHEHHCYFSLTALQSLFAPHGLSLHDVERVPIHGGSLRVTVAHAGSARGSRPAVQALLDAERAAGLDRFDYFARFGETVAHLKAELTALLHRLKAGGASIAAYGASAKGASLLNAFGIGRDVIDFVADRSDVKQGKLTPGTHLPIVSPAELLARQPDYVLLLTWNFADEILRQQAEYRRRGGQFIVPSPELRVV